MPKKALFFAVSLVFLLGPASICGAQSPFDFLFDQGGAPDTPQIPILPFDPLAPEDEGAGVCMDAGLILDLLVPSARSELLQCDVETCTGYYSFIISLNGVEVGHFTMNSHAYVVDRGFFMVSNDALFINQEDFRLYGRSTNTRQDIAGAQGVILSLTAPGGAMVEVQGRYRISFYDGSYHFCIWWQ